MSLTGNGEAGDLRFLVGSARTANFEAVLDVIQGGRERHVSAVLQLIDHGEDVYAPAYEFPTVLFGRRSFRGRCRGPNHTICASGFRTFLRGRPANSKRSTDRRLRGLRLPGLPNRTYRKHHDVCATLGQGSLQVSVRAGRAFGHGATFTAERC